MPKLVDRKVRRAPVRYTEALADEILDRLSNGEALNSICADPHMPDEKAVRKWAVDEALGFGPKYTRAREMQADWWAEEIISISDSVRRGASSEEVNAARLAVDSRKWIASKLMPRRYGDRVTVEGNPDAPLQTVTRIELVPITASSAIDFASLPIANADDKDGK